MTLDRDSGGWLQRCGPEMDGQWRRRAGRVVAKRVNEDPLAHEVTIGLVGIEVDVEILVGGQWRETAGEILEGLAVALRVRDEVVERGGKCPGARAAVAPDIASQGHVDGIDLEFFEATLAGVSEVATGLEGAGEPPGGVRDQRVVVLLTPGRSRSAASVLGPFFPSRHGVV